ncbi:MAG: hypothetical protein IT454_18290 [Planctomycetes bacterium]|nr:hypothetical protein [Planctomycetota bacterium]
MNDMSARRNYGRDALGILLCFVGLFSAVMLFMSMVKPVEGSSGGLTAFYMGVAEFIGPLAGIFAALGMVAVGARLWLKGVDLVVLRHMGGLVLTTFTLSILVGTLVPDLAGDFGAGIAWKVAAKFHRIIAVAVGVALVLLPAWFLWLRPTERARDRADSKSVDPKVTPPSDADGVTAAEAEALLPRAAPAAPKKATEVAPAASRAAVPTAQEPVPPRPPVASPYPPDVRRFGGIPEGARPLESPYAKPARDPRDAAALQRESGSALAREQHRPADAAVGSVGAAPAQRVARPDEALRDGDSDDVFARPSTPAPHTRQPEPLKAVAQDELASAAPAEELEPREEVEALAAEHAEEASQASALSVEAAPEGPSSAQPYSRTPPPPSWEQPSMFEEPVDAYGTPLSLVEALRKEAPASSASAPSAATEIQPEPMATRAAEGAPVDLASVDLDDDADIASVRPLPLERETPRATLDAPLPAAPTLFESVVADEIETQAPLDLPVAQLAHEPQIAAEPAASDDAPLAFSAPVAEEHHAPVIRGLFDDLPAAPPPANAASAPQVPAQLEREDVPFGAELEDDGEFDEARSERDESDDESDDDPALEEQGEELERELDESTEEQLDGELRFDLTPEASADEEPAEPATPLFTEAAAEDTGAAREEEAPLPGTATSSEPEPVAELSEIVLEPQPAPKSRSTRKPAVSDPVFKAGLLFVERNRVAVSMLQREFQMDFKQATDVLDQLQAAGLIGPYLGGQRRDILMTADQWRETAGAP